MDSRTRRAQFPIGAAVTVAELERDPYPVYARLRAAEPVSWIDALQMWWVTDHPNVRATLLDDVRFTTVHAGSMILDTFGEHMLTSEGETHRRYRSAIQPAFMPRAIRANLESAVAEATRTLIDGLGTGPCDIRATFAARLPIQTILLAFGLPLAAETRLRDWYDGFEAALSNFAGDEGVRARASECVAAFHAWIDEEIARLPADAPGLLAELLAMDGPLAMRRDEIRRNLLIIFFGAISTVEALILNAIWALSHHPAARARVAADRALIPATLDETMRWLGPVQSATRHTTEDVTIAGVAIAAGETVNCMLGGANHDPAVFADPACFDIDRRNAAHHLGFATGPHLCLGFRLAKMQVGVALDALLDRFPALAIDHDRSTPPRGYEFRQSKRLILTG